TLPRRGYRFIGPLDPEPEVASTASRAASLSLASGVSPPPAPPQPPEPGALEAALRETRSVASVREPVAQSDPASPTAATIAGVRRPRIRTPALPAALAVAALLTGAYALWSARSGASRTDIRVEAPAQSGLPANVAPPNAVAFSPPPHSIAVMPF